MPKIKSSDPILNKNLNLPPSECHEHSILDNLVVHRGKKVLNNFKKEKKRPIYLITKHFYEI